MNKQYETISIGRKQKRLHRYLMEKEIGRELSPDELVHHINGNRYDNRLCNLKIVTRSQHKKEHPDIGIGNRFKRIHFIEKKELEELYINKMMSISQIAKIKGMSQTALRQIRINYGIERPATACEICGRPAEYIKSKRCYKCYLKEWRGRNKKPNN